MTNQTLLEKLAADEGFESVDALLRYSMWDSIVPGICGECYGTMDCEPDARENYCDNCGGNTVQSGLVLAGII